MLLLAGVALLCLALGLGVGVWGRGILGRGSQRTLDTSLIIQQVQTLAQWVTVSYHLEKVVVLEDVKWSEIFGTSRVLMVAHGVVKAGVDLRQLPPQAVRVDGKSVSMALPPARITDAYLDESRTQVIERSTGLLRMFDKTLESAARQQALEDIKRAARHGGILKEADQKAREQLAHLFHQLGFEHVEFLEPAAFAPRPD